MTYRERRQQRAARLREWSGKRAARSDADHAAVDQIAGMIPFGQPILVGHHSEKRHRRDLARIDNGMRSAVENDRKAREMAARADEIERQAASAIYSDDPDAIERLQAKIAGLEAERERRKQANAEFRKANRELLKGMTAYERGQAVPFPSYSLQNIGGNISRCKARLAQLKRGPVDRLITARYAGRCADCGAELAKGDLIRYSRVAGARCATCPTTEEG